MSPALDGGELRKPPSAADLPECEAMVTTQLGANIGDTRHRCGRPAQFPIGNRNYCYAHWRERRRERGG